MGDNVKRASLRVVNWAGKLAIVTVHHNPGLAIGPETDTAACGQGIYLVAHSGNTEPTRRLFARSVDVFQDVETNPLSPFVDRNPRAALLDDVLRQATDSPLLSHKDRNAGRLCWPSFRVILKRLSSSTGNPTVWLGHPIPAM